MRESVQKLHEKAVTSVNQIHTGQKDLIQILQEMEKCHGYRDFECKSLWEYCLTILKIDEHLASSMIAIARKATKVPELKKAIDEGRIQISKARRIVPVLTQKNKSQWIEKA